MPITKSAHRALRQSLKRKQKNLQKKEVIKTTVKQIKKLITQGKTEEAKSLLSKAYKSIDKASKSYLHKRTASRKKSRLALLVNKHQTKA